MIHFCVPLVPQVSRWPLSCGLRLQISMVSSVRVVVWCVSLSRYWRPHGIYRLSRSRVQVAHFLIKRFTQPLAGRLARGSTMQPRWMPSWTCSGEYKHPSSCSDVHQKDTSLILSLPLSVISVDNSVDLSKWQTYLKASHLVIRTIWQLLRAYLM